MGRAHGRQVGSARAGVTRAGGHESGSYLRFGSRSGRMWLPGRQEVSAFSIVNRASKLLSSPLRPRSQRHDVEVETLPGDLEALRTPQIMGVQLHLEWKGGWMPEKLWKRYR